MNKLCRFAGAALLWLPAAASAQAVSPLPEALKPSRMSGMGLNVKDIEREKTFYTDVLGYKVVYRVPAKDGSTFEYLLGLTGSLEADTLLVLTRHDPVAGSTSFGRVILVVSNGRGLAERVVAGGGKAARIVDGTNMVSDPEGNPIELYQRPAPTSGG